jgi:hypothetical protein
VQCQSADETDGGRFVREQQVNGRAQLGIVAAGVGEKRGTIGRVEGGEVDVLDLPPALVVHGVVGPTWANEKYSRRPISSPKGEDEMDVPVTARLDPPRAHQPRAQGD